MVFGLIREERERERGRERDWQEGNVMEGKMLREYVERGREREGYRGR